MTWTYLNYYMNFCTTIFSSRQGMCVLLMATACTSNPFFCAHNPHVEAHSLLLICILLRLWSWSYFVIGILKLYNHHTILSCCSCKFWVFLELTWTGLVVPSKLVQLWWSFFLCNSREIFVRQFFHCWWCFHVCNAFWSDQDLQSFVYPTTSMLIRVISDVQTTNLNTRSLKVILQHPITWLRIVFMSMYYKARQNFLAL